MITELFLSTKVKAFIGILLVFFIVVETDKNLHKMESIKEKPKTETDTVLVKRDSLKYNLERSIEKAEKATKQLHKICKKT